jgi:hypothetical protein
MQDAADHATIIRAFLAAYIRWQERLDLPPLLVVQPEQVSSHHSPDSTTERGNQRITNRFATQHIY